MNVTRIINEIIDMPYCTEWLEFKTNNLSFIDIGKFVSAISNSSTINGKEFGYMVWGIDDSNRQIVGTDFNYNISVDNETLTQYLNRNINPHIQFEFVEEFIDNKKVVILIIPCCKEKPTEFNNFKYFKIGSSRENFKRYPLRLSKLEKILSYGTPSLINTDSERQDLKFSKLFLYCMSKGIVFDYINYEKTLNLRNNETGNFNLLALLLSDHNAISMHVSTYKGNNISSGLKNVKEFGNICVLQALDSLINYFNDVINVPINNNDYLFDGNVFKEAILNAYIHNNWKDAKAPRISIFNDRIEITSHGLFNNNQNYEDFYNGLSRPINSSLYNILNSFDDLKGNGNGVRLILEKYGKNAFTFDEETITVTIPFVQLVKNEITDKDRIIDEIKVNPFMTAIDLSNKIHVSLPMVTKHIRELRAQGLIEHIGPNKKGYWKVKD